MRHADQFPVGELFFAVAPITLLLDAYRKIFDRFGLRYRAVAADSGAIGGDVSQEFQVIAATGRRRDRLLPRQRLRGQHGESRGAGARPCRAGRRPQPLAKTPTPGKSTCEDVALLLGVPLSTTVKSLVLATDIVDAAGNPKGAQVWLLLLRGDHDMNEIKVSKVPGLDKGFRFATSAEIENHFGCKPGYLGPHRTEAAREDRGRPRGRRHGRLDHRRQRSRLPHDRRQLGPRPARARRGGRHPQRGRGRRLARRQGRAGDRTRHRGRPRVRARHQVQQADERNLSRRRRQAAVPRDGLLRHRHHAPARRGHRAEPRRARDHLARRDRAFHGGGLPDRHGPQRRGQGGRRGALRSNCWQPASTCCSTTAASVRARCSPTGN